MIIRFNWQIDDPFDIPFAKMCKGTGINNKRKYYANEIIYKQLVE